jgi:death-on-curing protein
MTAQPWVHLVDKARVLELHAKGLERYGGLMTEPKEGCVEGSLGNAWTAESYHEGADQELAGLTFAACTLLYLATNHCFTDGNKRVSWMALTDILAKLGLMVEATQDEAEAFVKQIADGSLRERPKVVAWIAERLAASPHALLS